MKSNGNILVIEPNNGLLTSLGILLKKHFDKVETIDNIQQAEGLMGTDDFDVALIDLDLFHTKSKVTSTLSSLRESFKSVEIVFLSTFSQIQVAAECIELGAFDFVHKPWNEYEIVVSIRNAVIRKEYRLKVAQQEKEIEKLKRHIDKLNDKASIDIFRGTNSVNTYDNPIPFSSTDNYGLAIDETLDTIELRIIQTVMMRNRGNMSLSAQQLGITRQTLYNKLRRRGK